ncbi:ATP-dependent sacrificial sulfur transferase LarE [Faecalicatena contorta]|uniref:ATP-dependent sacrificial sulfur transferase LarE n=1 Tax=Faecalicatena fissicatena TaxID=290055 RepID=A0ABS2E9H2_9FIRM|nr:MULTISPECIES: ATP-dependent sacrificial sulfur transferase LarE [Clostridia]MBM6686360.1 ATP-dependent sacrificial sulfur transferase LarE [Faecalicatena contorta]MBM6711703.1 ATP-dependent sacrificial sulfur transferase LarE [Faecalicatena contorta]MBM6738265.1 ATP-dependent sacrificial sulfur transferase LarE [Faecalicatena fissicatena]HIX99375.1 ATP-dependent sacrificial sulfur transferase LarE [Candidatus Dorea intestinigallinarum]
MTLETFFREVPRAAVAFSGGTDSAFLLWAAKKQGCQIQAYYIHTAFQPRFELEDARRLAGELGIPMQVIDMDILGVPEAAQNGPRRCYYCKRALFTRLREQAAKDGYTVLLDGTNASDDAGDRPGMQALRELRVRSPLRECGITKDMVRSLSREAGLFTWEKPAYACLATRIPTGTEITREDLQRAEQAETALMALGFRDFRVRLSGEKARLQVTGEQMALAVDKRSEIVQALKPLFQEVLLDLEERSPSV